VGLPRGAGRSLLAGLGFYDYASDSRLPVTGGFAPDTVRLGPLKIPMPAVTVMPADVQAQSARFGDVARLLGHRLASQPDRFTLSLYWQAEKPDDIDYTVFVHVLNAAGQMVTGQDSQPAGGRYPTGIWEPGEIIPTNGRLLPATCRRAHTSLRWGCMRWRRRAATRNHAGRNLGAGPPPGVDDAGPGPVDTCLRSRG